MVAREDVVANTDYVGPGYGMPGDDTLEAIDIFARTEAILLDPVYSAKGGAGLIDLMPQGPFQEGRTRRLSAYGRCDWPDRLYPLL